MKLKSTQSAVGSTSASSAIIPRRQRTHYHRRLERPYFIDYTTNDIGFPMWVTRPIRKHRRYHIGRAIEIQPLRHSSRRFGYLPRASAWGIAHTVDNFSYYLNSADRVRPRNQLVPSRPYQLWTRMHKTKYCESRLRHATRALASMKMWMCV